MVDIKCLYIYISAPLKLWDPENPEMQTLVIRSDLKDLLLKVTADLKQVLTLTDMWSYLVDLRVLNNTEKSRIEVSSLKPLGTGH